MKLWKTDIIFCILIYPDMITFNSPYKTHIKVNSPIQTSAVSWRPFFIQEIWIIFRTPLHSLNPHLAFMTRYHLSKLFSTIATLTNIQLLKFEINDTSEFVNIQSFIRAEHLKRCYRHVNFAFSYIKKCKNGTLAKFIFLKNIALRNWKNDTILRYSYL